MGRRFLVAAAAAVGVVALITIPLGVHEAGGFAGWLLEVRGADEDRGWDRLNPGIQEAYGHNREAYLADVASVDWNALILDEPRDIWEDDGFVRVEARLLSGPESVPLFLIDRRIVHGVCDQDWQPIGIGAYEDRRPFEGSRFEAGGLPGGQTRCNDAFREAAADVRAPDDGRPTQMTIAPDS